MKEKTIYFVRVGNEDYPVSESEIKKYENKVRDVIQYDGDNVVGLPYYVEIQSIDIAYTEDQDDDIEGLDDLNLYLEEN